MQKSALSKACFFHVNFLNGLCCAFAIQLRTQFQQRDAHMGKVLKFMCYNYLFFIGKVSHKRKLFSIFHTFFFPTRAFSFGVFLS